MAFRGHSLAGVVLDEASTFSLPGDDPAPAPPTRRGMTSDGQAQIVEVEGKYGYAWHGEPFLEVGDAVVLPGRTPKHSRWVGRVTGMGSEWSGEFKRIVRRASAGDIQSYAEKLEDTRARREFGEFKDRLRTHAARKKG